MPIMSLPSAVTERLALLAPPVVPREIWEGVTVEAEEQEILPGGVVLFRKGVRARYGFTFVTADLLAVRGAAVAGGSNDPIRVDLGDGRTVSLAPEEGYAIGAVRITDPEASATATDLRIRWGEGSRRASATDLKAIFGGTRIEAARANIEPERWTLFDVRGTTSRSRPPLISARAKVVEIVPGVRAKLRGARLGVLGAFTPALPFPFGFSLDRRSEGLRLPSLTYRRDQGIGVSAGLVRLPDASSQILASFAAFPGSSPSYGASYVRTLLPPDLRQARLQPVSDLNERFFFSFFESVFSAEPESEVNFLTQRRASYGIESEFNYGASGRVNDDRLYSKAVGGVFEIGGAVGSGGYRLQLRPMIFREERGAFAPRAVALADYARPIYSAGRTYAVARLDAYAAGGKSLFGFAGGEVGVAYRPTPNIILGAGAFAYAEAGRAAYTLDPLAQRTGAALRLDINTAPTKLSVLMRYDGSLRQFDREYRISQVVGAIEPVIVYREFPRTYSIGFRFRLDDLKNLVARRDPRRRDRVDPFAR